MTNPTPDYLTAYEVLRGAVVMVRAGELPADMLDWAVTIADRAAGRAAAPVTHIDGDGSYDDYMAAIRPKESQ